MTIQTREQKPITFTVLERAVLYARVSGDDTKKEGRNLAGQLEMGRDYARQNGYNIVTELSEDDRGESGAEIDLPQLNRVREMAHRREFDVLIVRELDRLSRNLAKQLIVEEELSKAGVRIEYILASYDDTPEGRLQKHIRATVAEYEREKIIERMNRGKYNSVKSGNVITRVAPYGYRRGEVAGKKSLVIEPQEADIVRMIFNLYAYGDESGKMGLVQIAKRLSHMKALTASDKGNAVKGKTRREAGSWGKTTVHKILTNQTYTGLYLYSRGKKQLQIDVPAIIDMDVWEAVQARLEQNKKDARRNRKYEYLFYGRVKCGHCNGSMRGMPQQGGKYRYYRCNARLSSATYECDMPYINCVGVDNTVWDWLERTFTDAAALQAAWEDYKALKETETQPVRFQLAAAQETIARHEAKLKGYLQDLERLSELGLFEAKEATYQHIKQNEDTLKRVRAERDKLLKRLEADSVNEQQIKSVDEFIAQIGVKLPEMGKTFAGRRQAVELLDVYITIAIEDGQQVVYATCYFGAERLQVVSIQTGCCGNQSRLVP